MPTSKNVAVTLYVGHDLAKPWSAYCGAAGETYLPLPAGVANNYSSYPDGECADVNGGAVAPVKTTWTRVRIDPATLVVTTNDYAGATTTGATHEVSGNGSVVFTYQRMPFATGRTCENDTSTTVGKVDLTGTKFRVTPAQFVVEGYMGSGGSTTVGQVTTLAMRGFPAGVVPCRPAGTDYYQRNGGKCLQLEYAP